MNATIENKKETAVTLAEAIAAHRFAANMKPEHLNRLAEAAMSKQFGPGENIFTEGEPANCFYLICQGKIALESRGDGESPPLVQFIGEGEMLGWSWLFPPYYWHFSARAVEPTNAICFLRHAPARSMRGRPGFWLRTHETHGRDSDQTVADYPGAIAPTAARSTSNSFHGLKAK